MIVNYKNVSVTLDDEDNAVLNHINLQVNEREFVFLKGKVGTGKTTFLRTLYGMIPVEGDEAKVLDWDMLQIRKKEFPMLRRQMGIIFQNFQLLPDRTVFANLEFVLKATKWNKKEERDTRIAEVLEMVKLTDKAHQYPHKLSGGEQQRVAIARAILNNPKLIIADEPTGNLDYENSKAIVDILYDISQHGAAVIMTTHNLQLISMIPSRIIDFGNHTLTEVTGTEMEQEQP